MEHGLKACKAFTKLIKQTKGKDGKPGKNRSIVVGHAGEDPVLLVSPKKPSTAVNELKAMSKKLGTFNLVVMGQVVFEEGEIIVKAMKAAQEGAVRKTFIAYYAAYKQTPMTKSIKLLQPNQWEVAEFDEDPEDDGDTAEEDDEGEGDETEGTDDEDSDGDGTTDTEETGETASEEQDGEPETVEDPTEALKARLGQLTAQVKKLAGLVAAHPELRPFVVTASTALNGAMSRINSKAFDIASQLMDDAQAALVQGAQAAKGAGAHDEHAPLSPEDQETKHALSERLKNSLVAVRQLGDGAGGTLSATIKEIAALLQAGKLAEAEALFDGLETGVAEATKQARNTEAEETSGHRVEYAKLLLRWRQAKTLAAEQLDAFGKAVLADPEVQADPRYEEVKEVVATFHEELPDFGTDLDDLLDELDGVSDPQAASEIQAVARNLIEEYADALEGAEDLKELSSVASAEFGTNLGVVDTLSSTLQELWQRLAA